MKNVLLVILLLIGCWGCGHSGSSGTVVKKDIVTVQPAQTEESSTETNFRDTLPDFLKLSKSEKVEGTLGYLTGVGKSDSSGPYVIREYISDTLSFDLLFYPKNGDKKAVEFDSVSRDAVNDYPHFVCFAFVFPMMDPYKMADYHDINIKFPVEVKTYVRKLKRWKYQSQMVVKNLTELHKYEIKCIYEGIR